MSEITTSPATNPSMATDIQNMIHQMRLIRCEGSLAGLSCEWLPPQVQAESSTGRARMRMRRRDERRVFIRDPRICGVSPESRHCEGLHANTRLSSPSMT